MKKEHFLLIGSFSLALLIGLGLVRWLAPQFLGLPPDLQLVRIDKAVPPFFEGVFRRQDLETPTFIINDPLTRVRAKPFFPAIGGMGPNDLLGFRNRAVPTIADMVVIGDSQTYGNNANLEQNWPSQMRDSLEDRLNVTYAMAVGGWGAVQYLDMFTNATVFRPRVVVIAFYSGNDPLESFLMAYGNEHWQGLIPNPDLTSGDMPQVTFPAPESEWWPVSFEDEVATIFTPTLRLGSNQKHPAVAAGYDIMASVAARIAAMAEPLDIQLLFTVIPTKELVYAEKVKHERLDAPASYQTLVASERANIDAFAGRLADLPGSRYVDIVGAMQQAALGSVPLYPTDINGHPVAAGYSVIAGVMAESARGLLPQRPSGLFAIPVKDKGYVYALVNDEGGWHFGSVEVIEANGWPPGTIPILSARDFAAVPYQGTIEEVDPNRFGPMGNRPSAGADPGAGLSLSQRTP